MTVTDTEGSLTPQALRTAFANFPSGITAVAAMVPRRGPAGMTASSFTSVSLEPALVSVCVAVTSATWPVLRTRPRLGVSVLAEHHGEVARSLASKTGDRFAAVSWQQTAGGAVFVHGSVLWLECVLVDELPAGDHRIALLRIEQVETYPDVAPLVFHGSRFRQLQAVET